MKKPIFRTTFTLTVLHESSFDYSTLGTIHEEISSGNCIGSFKKEFCGVLQGVKAVKEIKNLGQKPSFFGIDNEGEII